MMLDSNGIATRIVLTRKELEETYDRKGSFLDTEVLQKSVELDKLIVQMLKASRSRNIERSEINANSCF